jgi:hypothetical protein
VFSLFYRSMEENETFLQNLGLKSKNGEKLESARAIERNSARASKARIERTYIHAHKKRINHSAIERICA